MYNILCLDTGHIHRIKTCAWCVINVLYWFSYTCNIVSGQGGAQSVCINRKLEKHCKGESPSIPVSFPAVTWYENSKIWEALTGLSRVNPLCSSRTHRKKEGPQDHRTPRACRHRAAEDMVSKWLVNNHWVHNSPWLFCLCIGWYDKICQLHCLLQDKETWAHRPGQQVLQLQRPLLLLSSWMPWRLGGS